MESNMHACFEIAGFYPHTFYAIPIYHSENFVIVFDKINKHILDNFMITYFTKRLKMKMFLILILQGSPTDAVFTTEDHTTGNFGLCMHMWGIFPLVQSH